MKAASCQIIDCTTTNRFELYSICCGVMLLFTNYTCIYICIFLFNSHAISQCVSFQMLDVEEGIVFQLSMNNNPKI